MQEQELSVTREQFEFATKDDRVQAQPPAVKPVSYFADARKRFIKNKGALVAFFILLALLLFAVVAPMISPYDVSYDDPYLRYNAPKNPICERLGWNFWDGCSKKEVNETVFLRCLAVGAETGASPVKNHRYKQRKDGADTLYQFRLDTYRQVGCVTMLVSAAEFRAIQAFQDENDVQIVHPAVQYDRALLDKYPQFSSDANLWYEVEERKSAGSIQKTLAPKIERLADGSPAFDENGQIAFIPNYVPHDENNPHHALYTSKMRVEGADKQYAYAVKKNGDQLEIRVNYYEYYRYYHRAILQDAIDEPAFLFGSTQTGKDVFTCLGSGARLSFFIAFTVSAINLFVGAIYGAIEGYYGGKLDLFMERFSDVLSAVPFMIVITLLKLHLGATSQLIVLFIAFFLTGWIGMASRTRMQFYRFKNQEYVLSARTLGASDKRIMFKHIFPNAIGTLITGSVLSIPATIFSESSLSYLGIINLQTGSMTSVGNMLASAQNYLTTYPYMTLFPALFICLLMLSFNLLGNGLRDAFNPSLRGTEN